MISLPPSQSTTAAARQSLFPKIGSANAASATPRLARHVINAARAGTAYVISIYTIDKATSR